VHRIKYALLITVLLAISTQAQADPILFTFEDQTATSLPHNGALTSLTMTQSGLTLVVTRPGSRFDISYNVGSLQLPTAFGYHSLDPLFDTSGKPFIADFSQPVTSFTIVMAAKNSELNTLRLTAFSDHGATGNIVSSYFDYLVGEPTVFVAHSLTVSFDAGFNSVSFIGGTQSQPNSVYYDNMAATVVPEPSSSAVLLAGLCALGCAVRLRRRSGR
jgi:hypothetical protein